VDPAREHNERILADRERRIQERQTQEAMPVNLGLDLERKPATSAAEFIRDEFDRKNFGDPVPTYTRVLYGPDPLLITCPGIKERIEAVGLEDYAAATADAILAKQERAFDDPLLRKGIRQAIKQFGVDAVAEAFKQRILRIPSKTVEVEADRGEEDEIYGRPLEDAVRRYGNPGMAPKFLSKRCIDALGMRGYRIVIDEHGDPVRVGTLIMGEIPIQVAERRRLKAAELSNDAVREQEEAYVAAQSRFLASTGAVGVGSRPLEHGETLVGNASEPRDPVSMGVRFEREP
jgi:hypothetical protein